MAPELLFSGAAFGEGVRSSGGAADGAAGCSGPSFISANEQSWLREQGYRICAELASGSNGTVFRAASTRNEQAVAIKVVPVASLTSTERGRLRREILTLKHVAHRGVVDYVDALESDSHVYIVTELMKEDLFERTTRKVLTEAEAVDVAKQLLVTLRHLHRRGIYHRDIKLENIMVARTSEGSSRDKLTVKLVDFGGVHIAPPVPSSTENDVVLAPSSRDGFGTTYYLPPEVVEQREYRPSAVDMWGLGVVLYSSITGHFPFYGRSNDVVFEMITKRDPAFEEPEWKNVSVGFMDFLRFLLRKDQADRASVDKALEMLARLSKTEEEVLVAKMKRDRKSRGAPASSPLSPKKKVSLNGIFSRRKAAVVGG